MEPITKAGRRRTALNEALHELRRPLQALALSSSPAEAGPAETSLRMAAAALERLDREINGGAGAGTTVRLPLAARPLVEAAVARWQPRATLRGGSLELRWEAADATVSADRCEISQALDNLIVNALEHGGPEVVVAAARGAGELRVSVVDSGRAGSVHVRRGGGVGPLARLRGKRRHGHGLRVVRRIAAAHGGSFRLRCAAAGAEAELELPLLDGGPG
jgi:signal transduction histidine kinase